MVKQGDIILLNFDPQSGHEQRGMRPALVVSNSTFNRFCKMAMVCPITNTDKGHPLHIPLDERTQTTGVVLCDQARILDIEARFAKFIEPAPSDILFKVSDLIISFIETEV